MTMSADRYVEEVMELPYHRIVVRDPEGGYSSQVLEFDGCFSAGDTANEAMEGLEEAMRLWIEGEIEEGRDVPKPFGSSGYSGRINLRLPASLHERAALRAEIERTSLNQIFVSAISEYMGSGGAQSHTFLAHPWLALSVNHHTVMGTREVRSSLLEVGSDSAVVSRDPRSWALSSAEWIVGEVQHA